MADNAVPSASGATDGEAQDSTASPTPTAAWQTLLPRTSPAGPAEGKEVGGFRIDALIGKGESATVFQATQLRLERTVALKILFANRLGSQEVIDHFLAEAKRAAKLTHPNAVQVFNVGRESSAIYVGMELVKGIGLEEALAAPGGLTETEALGILEPVTHALSAARMDGILHRNLKPGNILITAKGTVKVADFGMDIPIRAGDGTALADAAWLGTMLYMSPEQCQGRELDERSDIYSLGIVLYQMLTGKMPFSAESASKLIEKVLHEPVPDPRESVPEISAEVAELVARLTAKDPAERFQSYEALEAAARPLWDLPRDVPPEESLAFLVLSVAFPEIAAKEQAGLEEVAVARRKTPLIAAAAVTLLVLVAGFGLRPFIWGEAGPSAPAPAPTPGEIEVPDPVPKGPGPSEPPAPKEILPDLKADVLALGEKIAEFAGRGKFFEGIKVFRAFEEQAGAALQGELRQTFEGERRALVSKILGRHRAGLMGIKACFDGEGAVDQIGNWLDELDEDFDQFYRDCRWARDDSDYAELYRDFETLRAHYREEIEFHRSFRGRIRGVKGADLEDLHKLAEELREYYRKENSLFKEAAFELLEEVDAEIKKQESENREARFRETLREAETYARGSLEGIAKAIERLEVFRKSTTEREMTAEQREDLASNLARYRAWEKEWLRFEPDRRRVESLLESSRYTDLEDALDLLSKFRALRAPGVLDRVADLTGQVDVGITGIVMDWSQKGWILVRRTKEVKAFLIAEFETTNGEYKAFIDGAGRPPPPEWANGEVPEEEDLPVTLVTPLEATAYCRWLARTKEAAIRLPTEKEWLVAAKWDGSRFTDYPWGERYRDGKANLTGGRVKPRGGQGSDVSHSGVVAMAGNVAEIVKSADGKNFAAKGGCCADSDFPDLAARSVQTQIITPDTRGRFLGFRVVRSLD